MARDLISPDGLTQQGPVRYTLSLMKALYSAIAFHLTLSGALLHGQALSTQVPRFHYVSETPYDGAMFPIKSILTTVAPTEKSSTLDADLRSWMEELGSFETRPTEEWRTPTELMTAKAGDTKAKAVALYERMRKAGVKDLWLVIGIRSPDSARTQAWLLHRREGETFILSPQHADHPIAVSNLADKREFMPLYAYDANGAYRAEDAEDPPYPWEETDRGKRLFYKYPRVSSTPYDQVMRPISDVLRCARGSSGEPPIESVNQWMEDLHDRPYEFVQRWQPPAELEGSRRPADCKGKSLCLYARMRRYGAERVSLIIGKARRSSTTTHAWLVWQRTLDDVYVVDPTLLWRPLHPYQLKADDYTPMYAFNEEAKFRAILRGD
jgi:predicted transglutaminase-like cysteine proteinase